jgi:tryptophan synthase alpha chain
VTLALAERMTRLRQTGRKAFVPFLTAGYPDPDVFRALLQRARAADFVEVGLPFSDPVADGPSICHASEVALAHGMHADLLFDALAADSSHPPAIVMTYANPVLAYGIEPFVRRACDVGVEGLLLTDVPADEAGDFAAVMARHGLASVQLVAPTTPEARMRVIAARTTGFLYCVAVTGTTGARTDLGTQARTTVERLRRVTEVPVVVGFGLSTPEHVRRTLAFADGVVIGSALVDAVRRGGADPVESFGRSFDALRAAAVAGP